MSTDTNWQAKAECRIKGYEADWWHPVSESDPQTGRAISICGLCPVRQNCLDYAITTEQKHGIWGGLNFEKRYPRAKKLEEATR